jgi:hypothetical protein
VTHTMNPLCLDAFERLLAQPDPDDLPRRAHVLRWEGEPNRRSTRLPSIMMSWLQRRFLEIDGEEALPRATRVRTRNARMTTPRLHVLRSSGQSPGGLGGVIAEAARSRSIRSLRSDC